MRILQYDKSSYGVNLVRKGRNSKLLGVMALIFILGSPGCKAMLLASIEPDDPFDETPVPAPPDYAKPTAWAALPTVPNNSSKGPISADLPVEPEFDVFFVHPTTYFDDEFWNAPMDDEDANEGVDDKVMLNQSSAFNGVAKVYAPRYRQATLGAFTTSDRGDHGKALDLAYQDVHKAFSYYLEHYNQGRPFFIASHSQGSRHTLRLVYDFVEGKPLHAKMVAAYIIGFPIAVDTLTRTLPKVGLCRSATQTGCFITYSTVKPDVEDRARFFEALTWFPSGLEVNQGRKLLCVNPITWSADGQRGPKSQHKGAWRSARGDKIDTRFVTAKCAEDGLLETNVNDDTYDFLLGKRGDYHLVDYSLFYMDIRANAEARAKAWSLKNQHND